MYFEALKIFCDVVRQRSFSRAAAINRITQSAVSQNVSQLEKGLGVRLIDRSKRPLQLTPEGEVYYEGCKGLVERYCAVEASVKAMTDDVTGTVTVAAIYSVGLSDMSHFVQQFAQLYPEANIRLSYLHPDRVYESVINEDVDLGLVSYPKSRKGVTAILWRKEPIVFVCDPRHRLAGKSQVAPKDFGGERFVGFDEGLTIRKEIDRYLRQHRVDVQVKMAFDNIETIKRAVEIGEGVTLLPEPTIRNEVRSGVLSSSVLAGQGLERPLGIIQRRSGQLTKTASRFVEMIRSGERCEPAEQQTLVGSNGSKPGMKAVG